MALLFQKSDTHICSSHPDQKMETDRWVDMYEPAQLFKVNIYKFNANVSLFVSAKQTIRTIYFSHPLLFFFFLSSEQNAAEGGR